MNHQATAQKLYDQVKESYYFDKKFPGKREQIGHQLFLLNFAADDFMKDPESVYDWRRRKIHQAIAKASDDLTEGLYTREDVVEWCDDWSDFSFIELADKEDYDIIAEEEGEEETREFACHYGVEAVTEMTERLAGIGQTMEEFAEEMTRDAYYEVFKTMPSWFQNCLDRSNFWEQVADIYEDDYTLLDSGRIYADNY